MMKPTQIERLYSERRTLTQAERLGAWCPNCDRRFDSINREIDSLELEEEASRLAAIRPSIEELLRDPAVKALLRGWLLVLSQPPEFLEELMSGETHDAECFVNWLCTGEGDPWKGEASMPERPRAGVVGRLRGERIGGKALGGNAHLGANRNGPHDTLSTTST